MLQKTMVVVEGVARKLNPNTNIWTTSKPVLENWLKETKDPMTKINETLQNTSEVIKRLPEFPEIMDKANQALTYLASGQIPQNSNSYTALNTQKSEMIAFRNQSIIGILVLVIFGLIGILIHSMNNLSNKKILLIICGGIAAYKSLEIIRLLKKSNVIIKTILTKSGAEFVTPLSITSLSQSKVYQDLFNIENEAEMDHISLSRWADLILIAPATANTISKLANGNSDDLASTVALASNKKIFIAPAMNVRMWEHESTKQNITKLKSYKYRLIGPEIGDMACGEYGEGKMSEPIKIVDELENYFKSLKKNNKLKAIVTAGPTNEYIDPVRFITNKSSGKQGYEIAKSLSNKGFDTTLISGPTNLEINDDINLIQS